MRKLRAAVCCTLGIAVMAVAQSASAANWFELQGISPALAPLVSVSGYFRYKTDGYIQISMDVGDHIETINHIY